MTVFPGHVGKMFIYIGGGCKWKVEQIDTHLIRTQLQNQINVILILKALIKPHNIRMAHHLLHLDLSKEFLLHARITETLFCDRFRGE